MKRLLLFGAVLLSFDAQAQHFWTGNRLHEYLSSTNSIQNDWGRGYVLGVVDAHATFMLLGSVSPWFCIPQGVTGNQVSDIVKQHLEKYPQVRHEVASTLVTLALTEAFPCRK